MSPYSLCILSVSLISDSSEGGFIVHSEGNGIFSYHMPGWSPPADPEFDVNEYYVSRKTYQASYVSLPLDDPTKR